jgi:hypothetical protein
MINFNVSLTNPWSRRHRIIKSMFGRLWSRKAWELNFYLTADIARVEFNFSTRCDHAGLRFELGFLGFAFEFNFYDSRHWNYNSETWNEY